METEDYVQFLKKLINEYALNERYTKKCVFSIKLLLNKINSIKILSKYLIQKNYFHFSFSFVDIFYIQGKMILDRKYVRESGIVGQFRKIRSQQSGPQIRVFTYRYTLTTRTILEEHQYWSAQRSKFFLRTIILERVALCFFLRTTILERAALIFFK